MNFLFHIVGPLLYVIAYCILITVVALIVEGGGGGGEGKAGLKYEIVKQKFASHSYGHWE